MSEWYSFVRSQDDTTASVSVDIGINAQRDMPTHPVAFILVRRIDDGAEPEPIRALEEQLRERLGDADMLTVGAITMSGSRTLVVYGNDEAPLNAALREVDVPFAVKGHEDPQWQIYRSLLPTNEEITR